MFRVFGNSKCNEPDIVEKSISITENACGIMHYTINKHGWAITTLNIYLLIRQLLPHLLVWQHLAYLLVWQHYSIPVNMATLTTPVSMATLSIPVSMATLSIPVSMATLSIPVSMATNDVRPRYNLTYGTYIMHLRILNIIEIQINWYQW